jgi:hypothetical protein
VVYPDGVLSSLPRSVSLQKFFIAACVRANQVATIVGDYRFWRPNHGSGTLCSLVDAFNGDALAKCFGISARFLRRNPCSQQLPI